MTTPTQMPESLKVVAYLTTDEEDSPAMLFFNQQEAGNYCALDEQPQELVLRSDFESALQSALKDRDAEIERLKKDAERYRWLSRKVSAHGVIDGWAFGFPTHLTLPAPSSAIRDPQAALGEAIDAAIDSMKGDANG